MRARDFQKPVIDMLEQGCLELSRALEDKPSLIESFEAWNETQSLLAKITGDDPKIGQKYSVLNLVVVPPGKMLLQQGSSRPIKLIGIKDRGSHLQYEFDAGDRIVLFPEDHRSGDQLSKTFLYSNPLDLKKIQTFITLNLDGWDVRDLVTENFADKKVKGKSRPGRVKRAGASCKGSVTDLRARARKYGGERGRMYHWCANMKSGRQKKTKR